MRFRTFGRSRRGISGADTLSIITSLGSLAMNSRIAFYSDVGVIGSLATGIHKIRLTHNADGIPSKLVSTGGGEESLTSTALGMPRDRKNNLSPLDSAFRRSYHYDVAARVDQMQNATADWQHVNAYDSVAELTGVTYKSGCSIFGTDSITADGSGISYNCPNPDSSKTFTYDAMGNRTDTTTVATGNRYSAFHGATISYDADGNVIEKYNSGVYDKHFWWSAESRLDSASVASSLVRYDYNALGNPVVRWTKSWGGSWAVDGYLIWDGDQLLLDLDASGNRRADYVYYPGTLDQPAAQTIGATSVTAIRDFRMDASGNVTGTVDGTHVSQTVRYDPWGVPADSGNSDNRLLWKGLMWEGPTDSLYYVRNRLYDPELGRFMSEDPIGHAGGDNLYAFGGNDPVNAGDPRGTLDCSEYYLVASVVETGERLWKAGPYSDCQGAEQRDVGGGGVSHLAPKSPINLLACAEASGNLVLTAVADYAGATELRAAFRAADAALTLGTPYLELQAYRDAGLIGKTRFARVATPVAHGALALAGGAGGHIATFARGQAQTAEIGTAMNSISILDFIPVVATIRAFGQAYQACTP